MEQRIYRAPGVYLEQRGPPHAVAFRTGVPVFVGFSDGAGADAARAGVPLPGMHQVSSWDQFASQVGPAVDGGFLDYAVRGFFENGGERCFVVELSDKEDRAAALSKPFEPFGLLEDVEEVDLICVPDIMMHEIRSTLGDVQQLQRSVLDHCERMNNRFAILDAICTRESHSGAAAGIGDEDVQCILACRRALGQRAGAMYCPWIWVENLPWRRPRSAVSTPDGAGAKDPGGARLGKGLLHQGELVPPSGHIAGIYARTDARVGVHKAPANEVIDGALELGGYASDEIYGRLNDAGVNCLRQFPGRGIRVWGARTLSTQPSGINAQWTYVNVRRLFLTFIRWAQGNMNDLVFEPNGPPLWGRVVRRLDAYCYELFERGALKGQTPGEAYFIKCDAETNPPDVREVGHLIAEIGLAPVVPAEFVIVRLVQDTQGMTVTVL